MKKSKGEENHERVIVRQRNYQKAKREAHLEGNTSVVLFSPFIWLWFMAQRLTVGSFTKMFILEWCYHYHIPLTVNSLFSS